MKPIAVFAAAVAVFFGSHAMAQDFAELDPIGNIAGFMDVATGHLSKKVTGDPTQKTQKTVVAKLDELIEKLEKECEACRGSGAGVANPTRPLADSVIAGGPGGSGDLHAARDQGDQWGQLPPHQRDRIMQSLTEGFPAHYQRILERYYRRLAEEAPDGDEDVREALPRAAAPPADDSTANDDSAVGPQP